MTKRLHCPYLDKPCIGPKCANWGGFTADRPGIYPDPEFKGAVEGCVHNLNLILLESLVKRLTPKTGVRPKN